MPCVYENSNRWQIQKRIGNHWRRPTCDFCIRIKVAPIYKYMPSQAYHYYKYELYTKQCCQETSRRSSREGQVLRIPHPISLCTKGRFFWFCMNRKCGTWKTSTISTYSLFMHKKNPYTFIRNYIWYNAHPKFLRFALKNELKRRRKN